jgi:hypothetical protein
MNKEELKEIEALYFSYHETTCEDLIGVIDAGLKLHREVKRLKREEESLLRVIREANEETAKGNLVAICRKTSRSGESETFLLQRQQSKS